MPAPILLPRYRVFLSSPGDVADERAIAIGVIDRLQYDPFLRDRATFEIVAWDGPRGTVPILATETPQASIDAGLPRPSECDVVVVLLWGRMGTPLPYPAYQRTDGTPYESGTEWEFEDALRDVGGGDGPSVLLYRRTTKVLLDPDAADFEERLAQKRRLDAFFAGLRERPTGPILHGYKGYDSPEALRGQLEADLRSVAKRLLTSRAQGRTSPGPAAPMWEGSPFPGLRSFTPDDAPIFFGRSRETDELVARVREGRFLAVVGASGSGKSSLVGAGLIPRLAAGGIPDVPGWLLPAYDRQMRQWSGLRVTPGELGGNPFLPVAARISGVVGMRPGDLAASLAESADSLANLLSVVVENRPQTDECLLFVDQFEELFTLVQEDLRERFVAMLSVAASSPRVRVVVTVRSDFYPRCLELQSLAHLLEGGQFPLAAPVDTLLEMITRPAERAGLTFEEGLPGRILTDAGREPGALPLLAYMLDELYQSCIRTDERVLTHGAYEALGGVQGAIGVRAETVFSDRLDPSSQDAFFRVFRELIEIDDIGRAVRRPARASTFDADEPARRLVDWFTDARLLVQMSERGEDPVILVAHEALFRGWPRLNAWIDTYQDDLRLLRKVKLAAAEWTEHGRDPSYLWPHERLEPVYAMLERGAPALDEPVRVFIRPEYERLLDVLRDPATESYRRQVTADRMVAIGEQAAPSLLDALSSPALTAVAASALVRIGAAAVPGLVEAATSPRAETRLAALGALRQIQDERAVPVLAAALRDEDLRVRSLAAGALEALHGTLATSALVDALGAEDSDIRWRAAGALGAMDARAVPPLLRSLHDPDRRVARTALDAISAIGEAAVEPLVEALQGTEASERVAAAEAAVAIGRPVVSRFVACLAVDDADVRWRAADVLGAIGDGMALPGLAAAARDPAALVRAAAFRALASAGGPDAVAPLLSGLRDDDVDVAESAAEGLASIGAAAVPGLKGVLATSEHPIASSLAARALGAMGAPAVAALREVLETAAVPARHRAADALEACGEAAIEDLCAVLRTGDDTARQLAAGSLVALGKPSISGAIALADDEDARVRATACEVIGAIAGRRGRAPLVRCLSDRDVRVRQAAVRGLALLGEESVAALFRGLEDASPLASQAAADALTLIGPPALPGLLELVGRTDDPRRPAAIAILARIGSPAAVFALVEAGLRDVVLADGGSQSQ